MPLRGLEAARDGLVLLPGIISAAIEGDRTRILEHLTNMGIGFHRENHA